MPAETQQSFPDQKRRLHVFFSGTVQGVGFRYTARSLAHDFPVTGWARNRHDGRVEMVVEGQPRDVENFFQALRAEMGGYIDGVERAWQPATGEWHSFEIVPTF